MASCLGLYIEENLIKYAKVSKDHDVVKIEAFGIKFYDKLGEAIKQIVTETFSFKVPISVNLSEEMYNYFYMFSLLNKNDLKKAVDTEFESYCADKGYNRNALETRFALVPDKEDKEKIKVIHVAVNKMEVNRVLQELGDYKVSTISPISLSIANIANVGAKENAAIVNIEENTTVTLITDQKIYEIAKIETGASEILNEINTKENSYSKSYEICKNSTIYTMEGKELQEEENEYLAYIIPTLYKIATQLKDMLDNSLIKVERVYLTGTASVINNIDLYFEEILKNVKCEILKPFFLTENVKINIKDFIEVNSAIALALQGLGYGIRNMNFKQPSFSERIPDWMKIEIDSGKDKDKNGDKKKGKFQIYFDLNEKLDNTEKWLLRVAGGIFAFVAIYAGIISFINIQIDKKAEEVADLKRDTLQQIAMVQADTNKVKEKTNKYISLTNNLKNASAAIMDKTSSRNAIPTLLQEIMYIIPKDVQVTAIENTSDKKVVINVQSEKLESLAYFKVKLKSEGILNPSSVNSSPAVNDGSVVKIVIEGEMP